MRETKQNTHNELTEKYGNLDKIQFKLYRGVKHDINSEYHPHPLESWSDLKETTGQFAGNEENSHKILTRLVSAKHILWHHEAKNSNDFIPTEHEVRGKRECTLLATYNQN